MDHRDRVAGVVVGVVALRGVGYIDGVGQIVYGQPNGRRVPPRIQSSLNAVPGCFPSCQSRCTAPLKTDTVFGPLPDTVMT